MTSPTYRSIQAEVKTVDSGAFLMSIDNVGRLLWVGITTDAAPTTSEFIQVALDSASDPLYDHVLFNSDPSIGSDVDTVWGPEYTSILRKQDKITVSFPNTDNNKVSASVYYLPF